MMYFKNNYCDVCSAREFTTTFDERPIDFRCLNCSKVYHTCHKCLGGKCPSCNGELKLKTNTFPDVLFNSLKNGNIEDVKEITRNNPINYASFVNEKQKTLLMLAAVSQNYEMCKFLIDSNLADVLYRNDEGYTALSLMIRFRSSKFNLNIIDLLQDAVNIPNNKGITPLMIAVTGAGLFGSNRGNIKIVKKLLNLNADIFAVDIKGFNALDYAVGSNKQSRSCANQPIVEFLMNEIAGKKTLS